MQQLVYVVRQRHFERRHGRDERREDGKGGTLFWSTGADPTFKDLGGRVEGTTMIARVQHFSAGFVGRAK
ncbi:MAG: hypothetical protein JWP87_1746 [Labilithrix sp.]|nr:hypothetical protein [Labilithrix sp.]